MIYDERMGFPILSFCVTLMYPYDVRLWMARLLNRVGIAPPLAMLSLGISADGILLAESARHAGKRANGNRIWYDFGILNFR